MPQYIIGIDLGTTNSALAYVDLGEKKSSSSPKIHTFSIPQLIAAGEMGERPLLPSFLYLPGEHDLPAGAVDVPWQEHSAFAVGEFARNHGAKIPGRLVTSAKSWLCHGGVDRTEPLLPWNAPPEVERISPVEASARYLGHMRDAWNHVKAKISEENRLEKQTVVLTVPASFDDVARDLTMQAAKDAGFEDVVLLEEPQAAFYCWLATHTPNDAAAIKPGWHCLVVDVGGGTSDFSLIQAVEQEGELTFVRQAVGDHLLLGGDNMDLTLAKFVEGKLSGVGRLDAAQYGMLTQACRQAKEALLVPNPPASHAVTVVGRGRKVIGGTHHAELTPKEVEQVILDGFFPFVERNVEPERSGRSGLHEMGLPYVDDPAVTRHLACFLNRHHVQSGAATAAVVAQASRLCEQARRMPYVPQAILFNGGVFQPDILRSRVVDVLKQWYDSPDKHWQPLVLHNHSLDLAVSLGAAHFGWLRHTGGKRIGGGIPRSYYIAVGTQKTPSSLVERNSFRSQKPAVEIERNEFRSTTAQTVLCVVPQHLEEGEEVKLPKPELELSLGRPVSFPLFTSTVREDDSAGEVLEVQPNQLWRLPPLHTVLRGGKRAGAKTVPVTLAARCTEIGTVELWCEAKDGQNRWRLEFNVRDIVRERRKEHDEQAAEDGKSQSVLDVWPEEQVQEAAKLIGACYSNAPDACKPRDLTKALETALDAPRRRWPMGLCRRLWDFFADVADERRRSQGHLNRWYNLVGYVLRPGFGDSLDSFRVEQLWKMLHVPMQKKGKGKSGMALPEGGEQWWIMWRRVSGGLNTARQRALFNRLRPFLLAGKGKSVPKPPVNELVEMWRAAASLERLDVRTKEQLGGTLLRSLRRSPTPTYGFPSLTRLGARLLPYGPLNTVVHPQVVETWLNAILGFQPSHDSERTTWLFCLVQLARRSGQRALDVDDSHRRSVQKVLQSHDVSPRWLGMLEEVVELGAEDESEMLGDELPVGLRLAGE